MQGCVLLYHGKSDQQAWGGQGGIHHREIEADL